MQQALPTITSICMHSLIHSFTLLLLRYGYIYWTDIIRKVIMRAHLNGSNIREIVNHGLSRPGEKPIIANNNYE